MREDRVRLAITAGFWFAVPLGAVAASWASVALSDSGTAPALRGGASPGATHAAVQGAPRAALAPIASAVRMPTDWMPAHGRECADRGRYKGFCQGPRRVPKPTGEDAAHALQLGLGTLRAAGDLMFSSPRPEWVQAAAPDRGETLMWPVDTGKLWRGLESARRSQNKWHPRHKGLDIGAPEGTPIRAAMSGIVVYSDNIVHGYGNMLLVVHADSSVALYGHCRSIYVFAGQHVAQGQVVGEVGHTGIARGTHLHFEYRVGGKLKNPLKYFAEPVATRDTRVPDA